MPADTTPDLGPVLRQMQGSMNTLISALTPEQRVKLQQGAEFRTAIDNYEKTLKPWHKAWKAIAVVGGIVAAIFGAGAAYQQFLGGNATKDDIAAHKTNDLEPVKEEVKKNTEAINGVKVGVDRLNRRGEAEAKVKDAQRVVDKWRREHDENIAEWVADKAAGRRRKKPEKRPELVEAELALENAQKELMKVE